MDVCAISNTKTLYEINVFYLIRINFVFYKITKVALVHKLFTSTDLFAAWGLQRTEGHHMKNNVNKTQVIPNRTMDIANLYHKQSLELINLALTHNKQAIDASHNQATELLQIKDAKNIHELVTAHMISQVRSYLSFATEAYQLGFDAHAEVANIFQQQIIDNSALTNEILKHHALAGNPVSTMGLSIVNSALHTGQYVIDSTKAAAAKTAELAKSALLNKSK
jgi:hypothetical protein